MENFKVDVENIDVSTEYLENICVSSEYKGETYFFNVEPISFNINDLKFDYEPSDESVGFHGCIDIDERSFYNMIEVDDVYMIDENDNDITSQNQEVFDRFIKDGFKRDIKKAIVKYILKYYYDDLIEMIMENMENY